MSRLPSPALRNYTFGVAAVVVGAGLSDASGSMWPLALGSAAALMSTAGLVRALRARAAERRRSRR